MSLHQKLLLVQGQLSGIPKSGWNSHNSYAYSTDEDVLSSVRTLLTEAGLVMVGSVVDCNVGTYQTKDVKGNPVTLTSATVKVEVTIIDPETGEREKGIGYGASTDKQAKSVYIATTGARKYAVRALFCISSLDDPEKDEPKRSSNTDDLF